MKKVVRFVVLDVERVSTVTTLIMPIQTAHGQQTTVLTVQQVTLVVEVIVLLVKRAYLGILEIKQSHTNARNVTSDLVQRITIK